MIFSYDAIGGEKIQKDSHDLVDASKIYINFKGNNIFHKICLPLKRYVFFKDPPSTGCRTASAAHPLQP